MLAARSAVPEAAGVELAVCAAFRVLARALLAVLSAVLMTACSLLPRGVQAPVHLPLAAGSAAVAAGAGLACPPATQAVTWNESFVWEGAPLEWLRSAQLLARGCKDGHGKTHGPVVFWDGQDNLVARGTFNHGKSDGVWRFYYEDGSPAVVIGFSNGLRHGRTTVWSAKGKKLVEGNWDGGFRDGAYRLWHANGRLAAEFHFDHGKPVGVGRNWYANGTLRSVIPYVDGRIQGVLRVYNERGELTQAVQYENGEVVTGAYSL